MQIRVSVWYLHPAVWAHINTLSSHLLFVHLLVFAAGWNRGSGREAPHPFSHPGVEEEGDRGHRGCPGQQEISSHAPQTAGRQGEPAQVKLKTQKHTETPPNDKLHRFRWTGDAEKMQQMQHFWTHTSEFKACGARKNRKDWKSLIRKSHGTGKCNHCKCSVMRCVCTFHNKLFHI